MSGGLQDEDSPIITLTKSTTCNLILLRKKVCRICCYSVSCDALIYNYAQIYLPEHNSQEAELQK